MAAGLAAIILAVSSSGKIAFLTGYFGSLHPHICAALLICALSFSVLGAPLRSSLTLSVAFLGLFGVIWSLASTRAPLGGPLAESVQLHVSSFNILASNLENGSRIAQVVAASTSDIFVVLEGAPIEPYLARIGATYPFRVGCDAGGRCDLVVFSRLPIERSEVLSAGPFSPRRMIRLTLDKSGRAFTLVAAHMTKPYFDDHGVDELEGLAALVRAIPGRVIVAGDFNQSSWSPMLAGFLSSTQLKTAVHEPATWPSEFGDFGIPIDHIVGRAGVTVTSVDAIGDPMGSNHRGLVASIELH